MTLKDLKTKANTEVLAGLALVFLFSVFLLLNFNFGFSMPFYILTAIVGLILPIVFPRSGIYAILALTLIFARFFTLQSFWLNNAEYKFYLLDIIFIAILASVFIRVLAGKIKFKIKKSDFLLFLFIFLTIVWFFAGQLWSDGDFQPAFSSFKNYAFYPLLFFATWLLIEKKEHFQRLFGFAILGVLPIIGFIIYGLIAGQGLWTNITPLSTEGLRILDFSHAFYLCLIFLVGASCLAIYKNSAKRWWHWLLLFFTIGIAGSLMRHLWLALLPAIFCLYVLAKSDGRKFLRILAIKYLAIGLLVFSILVLIINYFPETSFSKKLPDLRDQISTRAISVLDKNDSSIAWRGVVWQSVWKAYEQHPLTGIGFGKKVFIDLDNYFDYVEARNVHNSWLAVFVQMGPLGLIILLWLFFNIMRNVKKFKPREEQQKVVRLVVLSCGIFCLTAFAFQPYLEANFFSVCFWLNLGLGRRIYDKNTIG